MPFAATKPSLNLSIISLDRACRHSPCPGYWRLNGRAEFRDADELRYVHVLHMRLLTQLAVDRATAVLAIYLCTYMAVLTRDGPALTSSRAGPIAYYMAQAVHHAWAGGTVVVFARVSFDTLAVKVETVTQLADLYAGGEGIAVFWGSRGYLFVEAVLSLIECNMIGGDAPQWRKQRCKFGAELFRIHTRDGRTVLHEVVVALPQTRHYERCPLALRAISP